MPSSQDKDRDAFFDLANRSKGSSKTLSDFMREDLDEGPPKKKRKTVLAPVSSSSDLGFEILEDNARLPDYQGGDLSFSLEDLAREARIKKGLSVLSERKTTLEEEIDELESSDVEIEEPAESDNPASPQRNRKAVEDDADEIPHALLNIRKHLGRKKQKPAPKEPQLASFGRTPSTSKAAQKPQATDTFSPLIDEDELPPPLFYSPLRPSSPAIDIPAIARVESKNNSDSAKGFSTPSSHATIRSSSVEVQAPLPQFGNPNPYKVDLVKAKEAVPNVSAKEIGPVKAVARTKFQPKQVPVASTSKLPSASASTSKVAITKSKPLNPSSFPTTSKWFSPQPSKTPASAPKSKSKSPVKPGTQTTLSFGHSQASTSTKASKATQSQAKGKQQKLSADEEEENHLLAELAFSSDIEIQPPKSKKKQSAGNGKKREVEPMREEPKKKKQKIEVLQIPSDDEEEEGEFDDEPLTGPGFLGALDRQQQDIFKRLAGMGGAAADDEEDEDEGDGKWGFHIAPNTAQPKPGRGGKAFRGGYRGRGRGKARGRRGR